MLVTSVGDRTHMRLDGWLEIEVPGPVRRTVLRYALGGATFDGAEFSSGGDSVHLEIILVALPSGASWNQDSVLRGVFRQNSCRHGEDLTRAEGGYRVGEFSFVCDPGVDVNPSQFVIAGHQLAFVNDRRAVVVIVTGISGNPELTRLASTLRVLSR
jgi:hypothetical protein